MKKYLEDKVVVKKSGIHGKGIFSSVFIPEGEIILIINGEVINEKECIRREEEEGNVYIFWNDQNYIDVIKTKKIKYINHNCAPNCYIDENELDENSLLLISSKDINPGDELTIDYGYDEIYNDCKCGNCKC